MSTNQTHKFEKKWLYYSKLFAHLSGRSKGWDWSIQCVRRRRFGRIVDCNAILWASSWLLMGKEELHSYWRCTLIDCAEKFDENIEALTKRLFEIWTIPGGTHDLTETGATEGVQWGSKVPYLHEAFSWTWEQSKSYRSLSLNRLELKCNENNYNLKCKVPTNIYI